ncbi:hypothetical protein phytr_4590 [Candidatus Phycorickettsia trachydisci]|uniref:Uncharacterized protein n=2 Tax=Candidatus Phycorickettsia trachydisci TaxID=2115978 RepID=A0A2P1P807_9RICK|nr:hypothetical protein phytr_4590 [Candidatus Phycorickettsia trachydisci]
MENLEISQRDHRGLTPLDKAIYDNNTSLVNTLLEAGADPNLANPQGFTPLMMAVSQENIYMISYLLEKGADVNAFNEYGNTALHEAMIGNKEAVIQILLNAGANLEIENSKGLTPWLYAAYLDRIDIVRKFLELEINVNVTNTKGISALHIASKEHNKGIVQLLLSKGADSNLKNDQGLTPLMYAAAYVDIMEELLNANADVNALDQDRNTALHIAAHAGETDAVQLLLDAGADANITSEFGYTPLYRAVQVENIDTIHKLLKKGANVDAKTHKGKTPLHEAAEVGNIDVVEILLNHGADVNAVTRHWTPLLIAIKEKNIKVAQILINHNACLKFKNGKTILDFPVFMENFEMKEFIINTLYKRIKEGYTNKNMEVEEYEIAKLLNINPEFNDNIKFKKTLELFDESLLNHISDQVSNTLYNTKIEAHLTTREENASGVTYHRELIKENPEMYTNPSLGERNICKNIAEFLGKLEAGRLCQTTKPSKSIYSSIKRPKSDTERIIEKSQNKADKLSMTDVEKIELSYATKTQLLGVEDELNEN